MKEIFVVTHCESRHHVEGLVGGWYDSDLTDHGCRQAEVVARAVKSRVNPHDTRLVSSDLLRARRTGQVIADALGLWELPTGNHSSGSPAESSIRRGPAIASTTP